jgi:predicted permease
MFSDVRHAFRLFLRAPGLTTIALASMALSTGATAVVFTAVKSVLIEPLPYSDPVELVQLRTDFARGGRSHADWVAWNDMQDVIRRNHSFEGLGTYNYQLLNLEGDAKTLPEALYGLNVSASLFPTLGVKPMLGRNILPEEAQKGRDREIILSYGLWARRFHSDRSIVGRTVQINHHNWVILGVMPRAFDFPLRLGTTVQTPSGHVDFWSPQAVDPKESRNAVGNGAIARLRKGVSQQQADQELFSIGQQLAREYPRTNDDGRSLHLASLQDRTFGSARAGLWLALGATAIFMLIGCANVANLLLARGLARSREFAIRSALGAARGRIVRQLVTESSVLAVLGGLAGYVTAMVAWTLLPALAPSTIPRLAGARADGWVLVFAVAVSIVNGVLFGILPAMRAAGRDPAQSLRGGGLRSVFVAGEVAAAVVLVIIGGFLTASFVRLLRADLGFNPDHVLASIIAPRGDGYPAKSGILWRKILESVGQIPGVESVGAVSALPFSGENDGGLVFTDSAETERNEEVDLTSAGYLQTMGVRLLEGRWFREEEATGSREVAIVNDITARQLWPGATAVGKRICVNCPKDEPPKWKEVVGVVQSIRHASLSEAAGGSVYLPSLAGADFLVVRAPRFSADLTQAIRHAVADADPTQAVFLTATMSRLIGDSVADRRFIFALLATTGCLALLLAAVGVYGVVSYATGRRRREIGVRMAVGAAPRDILALVFRQGMRPVAAGAAIGIATALGLMRLLKAVLAGLAESDPAILISAVALVALVAALACLIPARRAMNVNPTSALRQE